MDGYNNQIVEPFYCPLHHTHMSAGDVFFSALSCVSSAPLWWVFCSAIFGTGKLHTRCESYMAGCERDDFRHNDTCSGSLDGAKRSAGVFFNLENLEWASRCSVGEIMET